MTNKSAGVPDERAAFEAWLSQGHSNGCNESMWKAIQAGIASSAGQPSIHRYQSTTLPDMRMGDHLMDNLLHELDQAAVRVDVDTYGLPVLNAKFLQSARAQIEWHVSAMIAARDEAAR